VIVHIEHNRTHFLFDFVETLLCVAPLDLQFMADLPKEQVINRGKVGILRCLIVHVLIRPLGMLIIVLVVVDIECRLRQRSILTLTDFLIF
jgi:hypothetical protein